MRIGFATALILGQLTLNGSIQAQEPGLVDLASNPSNAWGRPAISGVFGGPCFDCPRQPEPKLPLEIALESIDPIPGHLQESLVSILIRNVGAAPYQLPIGRDPDVALKPGNHGRREFWFDLKVAGERYSYYLHGQETYRSTDVPNSMMATASGGIVRVRFKVNLQNQIAPVLKEWQTQLSGEIRVEAAVVDELYDDNPSEYREHIPNLEAVSGNELRMPIGIMWLNVNIPL
jgi:hypothetical protein